MAFEVGSGGGVRASINVTPLVDVVLVLLIIFMVVTPMLQRGKDVQLPRTAKAPTTEPKSDPAVVSITADRKSYWESGEVTLEELGTRALEAQRIGRKVMVKGDARLTVGDVRPVLAALQKTGAKGVILAVEEKP